MPKHVLLLLSVVSLVGVAWSNVAVPSTWKTPSFPQWGFFQWGVDAETASPSEAELKLAGTYPFAMITPSSRQSGSPVDVTFIRGSNDKEKEALGRLDVTGQRLAYTTPAKFGSWFVRVRNGRSKYRRIEWPENKWANAIFASGTSQPGF